MWNSRTVILKPDAGRMISRNNQTWLLHPGSFTKIFAEMPRHGMYVPLIAGILRPTEASGSQFPNH
ncbi:MAG: hypothetical protein DMG61_17905 [Acidobacteria bacterium]|nr:MAG: hypothetical protein DMG61_17905 [Acidobacteriota bacterium]PYY19464.1 MAG: hypothetical protein DMG60_04200 [Acidobacteriota bacterium]